MAKRLNVEYQIGITGDTSQLKRSVEEAIQSLQKIGTTNLTATKNGIVESAQAALDLSLNLQKAYNVDTGKLDLIAFNKSLKASGMEVKDYAEHLANLGPLGKEAFLKVSQAVVQAELPLRRTNKLLDSLWVTMKNTARWQLTSSALHGFMGAVQTAYGYVKDLNESLTNIKVVTGQSAEEMDRFAQKANEAAKALSTTTTGYTDAALIYFRQGLSQEEVEGRAAVTIKLANTAGESAEKASEQMTAVWNNFYDGSKSLEYYADVMAKLGATTASSTQEISQGLTKFSAVADTVGLSYEYAAAALATVTAQTRESADTVGTAFRTIFGRLESLKLGESLDDGTDLNKYSLALAQVGVDIKDASGNLKDMDQILNETMDKWKTLSRDQQMALAQAVAGVRQYATFIALMDNSDIFKQNLGTAKGAEGELQRQQDIYAEGWEAARDRVRAAAEDIYDSLINDDAFINMDKTLTPVLTTVAKLIDGFGGMRGVINQLGVIFTSLYSDKIANGLRNSLESVRIMVGLEGQRARELKSSWAAQLENLKVEYEADPLMKRKLEILQEQVSIQNTINENEGKYSAEQLDQIKNEQALLEIMQQEALKASEIASKRKTARDERIGEISATGLLRESKDVYAKKIAERMANVGSSVGGGSLNRLSITSSINTVIGDSKGVGQVFTDLIAKLEEATSKVRAFEQASRENEENVELDWLELSKTLGLFSKDTETAKKEIETLFQGGRDNILYNNLAKVKEALKAIVENPEDIDKIAEEFRTVAASEKTAEEKAEAYRKVLERLKGEIKQTSIQQKDWAAILVETSNALMQINAGINAINSLGDIFTDEDLENTEVITRLLSAAAMLLPILVKGVQSFSATLGIGAAATSAVGAAATSATPAVAGFGAAISTALPMISLIAVLLYAGVKAYQYFNGALDRSIEKAQEATSNYKDLKEQLEQQNEEIEKLNVKIEEGIATEKEYERLKVLKEENRELQRQVELAETRATIARNEALRQFNGKKTIEQVKAPELHMVDATLTSKEEIEDYFAQREVSIKEFYQNDKEALAEALADNEENLKAYLEAYDNALDFEAYEKAEEQFKTLAEALESGAIELDDDRLTKNLKILQENRKVIYGDKYKETFIDPLLSDLNKLSKVDFDKLKKGSSGLKDVSEDTLKAIMMEGLSPEEVANKVQSVYVQAKEKLRSFGLNDNIEDLGYADVKIIADIENVDQLLAKLNDLREPIDLNIQIKDASSKAFEVLDKLANGELLDDETIKELQEAFSGIADLTGFGDLTVDDQIDSLQKLVEYVSTATNEQGRYTEGYLKSYEDYYNELKKQWQELIGETEYSEEKIKELRASYDSLQKTAKIAGGDYQKSIEKTLNETLSQIQIGLDLRTAEKQLEKLKNDFERDPLEVKLEIDDKEFGKFDSRVFAAKFANIREGLKLINDDLTVSADNWVELGKRWPQAMADAYYDAEQNILRIDEEKYNQLLANAYDNLDKQRDVTVQQLLDESQTEAAIVSVLEIAEEAKRALKKDTLTEALNNDATLEEAAKESSQRIVIATIDNEIKKRKGNIETRINAITNQTAQEKSIVSSLGVIEKKEEQAASNLQSFFQQALKNTTLDFKSFVQNPLGWTGVSNVLKKSFSEDVGTGQVFTADDIIKTDKEIQQWRAEIDNLEVLRKAIINGEDLSKYFTGIYANQSELTEYDARTFDKTLDRDLNSVIKDNPELANMIKDYQSVQSGKADPSKFLYKWGESVGALDAKTTAQKMADAINQVIQSLIDDFTSDSGDGGGKSLSKQKLSTLDDFRERYHEINLEIEEQDTLLKKTDTLIGRTYGPDRLKNFQEKIKQLNKQAENYLAKAKEAEGYLYGENGDLAKAQAKASAMGFQLNMADDGDILNYTSVLREAWKKVENDNKALVDAQKEFNQYIEEGNTEAAEGMQEKLDSLKDTLDTTKNSYEELKKALDLYEETLKIQRENMEKYEEALREAKDTILSEIEHKLEVKIDMKNLRKQLNDFSKEIAESFGDALTHGMKSLSFSTLSAQDEKAMYDHYKANYEALKAELATAENDADKERIRKDMESLVSNITESGKNLLSWIEEWENSVADAVDAAAERLGKFTSQLEHNTSVLDTIRELYALQGQTYRTAEGYARLQSTFSEQMDASIAKAQMQREWYEGMYQKYLEAQQQLDNYAGGETGAEYDYLVRTRDAFLKEYQEAQAAYLKSSQEAIEKAKDMYNLEIDKALYEFDQKVSGGKGTKVQQTEYDHYIETSERYLDEVNEDYQTASWYLKLQADIDKTTNNAYKTRLVQLQKEIDLRREGNTLSQYDLDYMEAEYKLLKAQMDLEDQRNNKTELRLVRDSQGNWNYQYTANLEQIEDAEQKVLDAANEKYNIAKQRVTDLNQELVQLGAEFEQRIQQIWQDFDNKLISEDERDRLLAVEEKYYFEKIGYLEREFNIAKEDMDKSATESQVFSAAAAQSVYEKTDQAVRNIINLARESGKTNNEILTQNFEGLAKAHNSYADNYTKKLSSMATTTQAFYPAATQLIDNMRNAYDNLQQKISTTADTTSTDLDTLDWTVRNLSDSTDNLAWMGMNEVDSLLQQMDAAYNAAEGYRDLARGIQEAIDKLKELASVSVNEIQTNYDIPDSNNQTNTMLNYDVSGNAIEAGSLDEAIAQLAYRALVSNQFGTPGGWSEKDILGLWQSASSQGRLDEVIGYLNRDMHAFDSSMKNWAQDMGFSLQPTQDAIDKLTTAINELSQKVEDETEVVERDYKNEHVDQRGTITISPEGFASGGYTGNWSDGSGKMAFLHEKELVLNQEDTENILAAVGMMRDITRSIDEGVLAAIGSLAMRLGSYAPSAAASPTAIDQNVHIDANFPNVQSSDEIVDALNSLVNDAAQWALRRTE